MRTVRLFTIALLMFSLSASARAQLLDGQWFKATATANGAYISGGLVEDVAAGEVPEATKAKFKKITHYVQLIADEGGSGQSYEADIWVHDVEGNWFPFSSGDVEMLDDAETFLAFADLTFYVPSSFVLLASLAGGGGLQGFDVQFTGAVKRKVKNEELTSAKIKSVGAIAQGSFTGNDLFVGGAKVTMTRVDASKLPFDPEVELLTQPAQRPSHPGFGLATAEASAVEQQPAVAAGQ